MRTIDWYHPSGNDASALNACLSYIEVSSEPQYGGVIDQDFTFIGKGFPDTALNYEKNSWEREVMPLLGSLLKGEVMADNADITTSHNGNGEGYSFWAVEDGEVPQNPNTPFVILLNMYDTNGVCLGTLKAWEYDSSKNRFVSFVDEDVATSRVIAITGIQDLLVEFTSSDGCVLEKNGIGMEGQLSDVAQGEVTAKVKIRFKIIDEGYNSGGKVWTVNTETDYFYNTCSFANAKDGVELSSQNSIYVSTEGSADVISESNRNGLNAFLDSMEIPTGKKLSGSTEKVVKDEMTEVNYTDPIDLGTFWFSAYIMPKYLISKDKDVTKNDKFVPQLPSNWTIVDNNCIASDKTKLSGSLTISNGVTERTIPCLLTRGNAVVAYGNWDSTMTEAWDGGLGDPYFITYEQTTNTFRLATFTRRAMNGSYVTKNNVVKVMSKEAKGELILNISRD